VSLGTYRVKVPKAFPGSNNIILKHLRLYQASPAKLGKRVSLPDTCKFLQEGELYNISEILTHHYNCCWQNITYCVCFKGHSSLADKWLSMKDLQRSVLEILRAYCKQNDL
jgi:hypothetical protein